MNKSRILIVEDEAIVARDLREQLLEIGYETVADTPAAEVALELVARLRPDLILMDISLAGPMDGIEAAQLIRARFSLPVVFLTAFASDEMLGRAKQAEPYGYILKPFDGRELRTVVEMALYKHAAESRVAASEQKLRNIVEHSTQLFYSHSPDNTLTYVSPQAREFFDCEPEEALRSWTDFLTDHPANAQGVAFTRAALATGERQPPYQLEIRTRRGRIRWAEVRESPVRVDGKVVAIVGALTDITDSKQVQDKLHLQSAALEAAANGIVITDRDGTIEWVNPAFSRLTGYSAAEVMGQNPRFLKSGTHSAGFYTELWRTIRAGEVWQGEITNRRKDGTVYWEEMIVTPVRDAAGVVTHFVAIKQDVTARRAADESLRRSEERFRDLVEGTNDLIHSIDADGRVLYANPAWLRTLGYDAETVTHLRLQDFIAPESVAECRRLWSRLMAGETVGPIEAVFLARDGRRVFVEGNAHAQVQAGRAAATRAIFRDVTERKLREAVQKAEQARLGQQRTALIALMGRAGSTGVLADNLRRLVETSARTLGVARVSIWRYTAGRAAIRCLDLYEAAPGLHSVGAEIQAATCPGYFQALQECSVIAADDARTDPRTREFAPTYLEQLGITSMLDVPIHLAGVADGVLCHEHVGPARAWTLDEQTFAIALANQVSLALESAERQQVATELRESETRVRAITDSAQDAIVMMNPAGLVSFWNPAAERILGYTALEALGRSLHDLIAPARYHAAHHAAFPGFLQTGAGAGSGKLLDVEARRKDGREVPVQLALSGIQLGGAWHLVGILRDVTDRKQAEAALLRARDAALESARLKSEFLANMSHEIRTPMNGVIGMLNLLADTELAPQQRDFAETARSSAESLLTLLNDILDFSKIEAGKLTMETMEFDLHDLLESTLELLAESGQAKGLELVTAVETGSPSALRGDLSRLRQVLLNLVGNAIKFTDRGEVVLRARVQPAEDGLLTAYFEVRDTGIGIASDVQARLFQAFVQADGSTTRKYGGTGLGLAISRRIVELMNGEIGVRSEPGRGSTFWFSVPLERGEDPAAPAPRASLAGQPILIVDDNATNRAVLHHQLAAAQAIDREAADGPEALRLMREAAAAGRPYPLVLLDLQMPGMDGLEVARAIKADPAIAGARVVMLTSLGAHLDTPTRRAAGIAECLFKPVRHSRLLDSLERHIAEAVIAPAPVAATPGPLAPRQSLRLLLAEDNVVNQKVALGQLRKLGYTADLVANGREAVAAHAHGDYDAILMDCQMPEMEGYEAARLIRRHEAGRPGRPQRPAYIIAMTAHALEGDREKCLAAGMDDYLSKPVITADLGAALARAAARLDVAPLPTTSPL